MSEVKLTNRNNPSAINILIFLLVFLFILLLQDYVLKFWMITQLNPIKSADFSLLMRSFEPARFIFTLPTIIPNLIGHTSSVIVNLFQHIYYLFTEIVALISASFLTALLIKDNSFNIINKPFKYCIYATLFLFGAMLLRNIGVDIDKATYTNRGVDFGHIYSSAFFLFAGSLYRLIYLYIGVVLSEKIFNQFKKDGKNKV